MKYLRFYDKSKNYQRIFKLYFFVITVFSLFAIGLIIRTYNETDRYEEYLAVRESSEVTIHAWKKNGRENDTGSEKKALKTIMFISAFYSENITKERLIQPFFYGADNRIRICTSFPTDPWNQRVYQFRHVRIALFILQQQKEKSSTFFAWDF